MHVWTFAYREVRKSNWISNILDRHRFELRKLLLEELLTEIRFFSKKKQIKIKIQIMYIHQNISFIE